MTGTIHGHERAGVSKRAARVRLMGACVALCALFAIGASASASAATLFVSNAAPPVPGGKSCAQPAFSSVQSAINAGGAGAQINICPGTYIEQLEISNAVKLSAVNGANTATVSMPAAAQDSASSCDTLSGLKQKDEISICTPEAVTITNLSIQAVIPLATCADGLYGVFVAGGGTLKTTNVSINGASTSLNDYKGCQHGVAVEVGVKEPAEVGHATLSKTTVTGYEKNGPTVKSPGSSLVVSASTVTGEGPSPYIAQNGIEVAYGAAGKVSSSTISGNECELSGVCSSTELEEQATGVLFYKAAKPSSVTTSTIKENDIGAYYASGSATVPATPDLVLSKDVLTGNRYEGVLFEEGKASLGTDTINGAGLIGILLLQQAGQLSESESKATATNVSGQSEAAIKVQSDKSLSDTPGKFTFANGTANGNGTVLINESNNFQVVF